ncbi:uncharacterized protein RHOBADRAFT_55300 [Rhodotorula graminis WP1]|uniref:Protein kinase domain-containing protein n=1 Tax=Rhodotorula graminis (strain WP1) TaxID=578459 RepID=A0A0P9F0T8_RHOGW|nr:uncharacterized protein RHOBADRAFT_55300 [Rhodotorula graminis WP1]KPV73066.1 hypothetical protein RHOBADRAFT_55300 [Rhodotorula graminis WP1]
MADPQAPLVTPSRPPVTVDISTIEAAKENIVPLHSGRSASQLAALSTSTRAGLGLKLDAEHARFQAQIAAVDVYEATGAWDDGRDGLAADDVALLAEDPLDVSHQYVRFIVANYPAGASAANKLVPVLEATTRKFLADGRYTNDPRYFRLWAHYAKNMEDAEDCYRFLFAKGVAEKLAALYEEYAKVLEAKHKRKQADQVYNLGINRRATPLDRLKRSYLDFQARMLVAPPVPSPPRPSAPTADARPILSRPAGAVVAAGSGTGAGTGVRPAGNGSLFAVFRDGAGGASEAGKEAGWEDYGTVKSRTRENDDDKKEWAGEVMPQKGAATSKPGGFKLEVFRDEIAAAAVSAHLLSDTDVFSRSSRAPTEADLLRSNPFKNYGASDAGLVARDPLEGLEVLPRAGASSSGAGKSRSSSREGDKDKDGARKVRSVKKPASSSSTSVSSSSSSSKGKTASSKPASSSSSADPAAKPKERVAINLAEIYPNETDEFSPEEVRARKHVEATRTWGGWEWAAQWDEETARTGSTSYKIDAETGWPVLYDTNTGAPLYDFLPRPVAPSPVPAPGAPALAGAASPSPASPTRPSSQPERSLLSPSPPPAQRVALELGDAASPARERSPSPPLPLDPNRPPSPTMNTRAANALLDHLFAKTLDFTKVNGAGRAGQDSSDDSDDDSDDDDEAAFGGLPGGTESQFSTQGATQQSDADVSDAPFAPFSQTRSQMDDDSAYYGSQQRHLADAHARLDVVAEGDENDENTPAPVVAAAAAAAPLQLFRDGSSQPPATPSGGFRPVTRVGSARAPLGMKAGTPLAAQPPPPSSLFSVFQDGAAAPPSGQGVFGDDDDDVVPSSQESDSTPLGPLQPLQEDDDSFAEQDEFEAPLRGSQDGDESSQRDGPNDGYDLGRRVPGQPSRYAPYVQQMTPIVERTLEFTNGTGLLSASQKGRRDSYYPGGGAGGTVAEEDEDEPSTEEDDDDEEDGDRAFVASFQQPSFVAQQPPVLQQQQPQQQLDADSSSDDSSDDSSDEDDAPAPSLLQEPVFVPPPVSSPAPPSRSSLGHDGSYDASLSTTLPDGLSIAGNQSGMVTDIVVDASTTRRSSSLPAADAPAPVDPYSGATLSALLRAANPPVLEHADVHNLRHETADRLAGLQKAAKRRNRTSSGKGGKDRTGTIDEAWDVELGGETFSVRDKLGEGSYGAVFRIALGGGGDDDDFDADAEDELSLAVKVENPANLWEFYVLSQLHARLPERARASVVAAQRLYAYRDESFLFLDYCDQGSLLDAVNHAHESGVAPTASGSSGQGVDELLAMFFVVEVLRTLEGFHASGFVHGDLKIDNCLLRLEEVPGGARAWAPTYDPSGANGWAHKGLKLIDFGRSIDLSAFPRGQAFSTDQDPHELDCAEMREGRPWTFEPDYYGAASIAVNLLFGRTIETKRVPVDDAQPEGPLKWTLAHSCRRYYQVDLWTRLFDVLLNPRSVRADSSLPVVDELAAVRHKMEEYLRQNGEKAGKSLRGLIKKLEIHSMMR